MSIEYKHPYHDLTSVTKAIEDGRIEKVVFIGESEEDISG